MNVTLHFVESSAPIPLALVGGGLQGPPGQAQAPMRGIAAVALGGHRVVYQAVDGLRYADASIQATAHAALGLTLGAAAAGAFADVQLSGEVTEPSWAFVLGQHVYLGLNGTITQTVPVAGAQIEIGLATAPTKIAIRIQAGTTLQ